MSRRRVKEFSGVTVYPKKAPAGTPVMVGVWIAHTLTLGQLRTLMRIANQCIGQMEVHSRNGAATIIYEIPNIPRRGDITRQVAVFLTRMVKYVTGEQTILEEMRTSEEVSRALALA